MKSCNLCTLFTRQRNVKGSISYTGHCLETRQEWRLRAGLPWGRWSGRLRCGTALRPGGSKSARSSLVWGYRKIVWTVYNNHPCKGKPVVGDKLEETTPIRNLVGMISPQVVHACDKLAAVACIRKSNLVGHPKRSQRGTGASEQENRNTSMNRTGGCSHNPCPNLPCEALLGKIEKEMRGTEEIHTAIRRTTTLQVLAHVLA
jgi:hypothetical protein